MKAEDLTNELSDTFDPVFNLKYPSYEIRALILDKEYDIDLVRYDHDSELIYLEISRHEKPFNQSNK